MATVAEIVGETLPDNAGEDSVSLLNLLRNGITEVPVREATVHQSSSGDLALRQGPWKEVFFRNGRRELYNLQVDVSETQDVSSDNPEITERLTRTMQSYIDRGRSTRGGDQKNDTAFSLDAKTPKKRKASKRNERLP